MSLVHSQIKSYCKTFCYNVCSVSIRLSLHRFCGIQSTSFPMWHAFAWSALSLRMAFACTCSGTSSVTTWTPPGAAATSWPLSLFLSTWLDNSSAVSWCSVVRKCPLLVAYFLESLPYRWLSLVRLVLSNWKTFFWTSPCISLFFSECLLSFQTLVCVHISVLILNYMQCHVHSCQPFGVSQKCSYLNNNWSSQDFLISQIFFHMLKNSCCSLDFLISQKKISTCWKIYAPVWIFWFLVLFSAFWKFDIQTEKKKGKVTYCPDFYQSFPNRMLVNLAFWGSASHPSPDPPPHPHPVHFFLTRGWQLSV